MGGGGWSWPLLAKLGHLWKGKRERMRAAIWKVRERGDESRFSLRGEGPMLDLLLGGGLWPLFTWHMALMAFVLIHACMHA